MVRIQELTDLRDYFQSSSEDSTRLFTPDRALPVLLLLNWKLYKWSTTSRVWCVEFHRQGVFIKVLGAVTDLIKSVIHHVLAGHGLRPPPIPGIEFHSTASWKSSLPRKLTEGCKVGSIDERVWLAGHPLSPHVSGFCTQPPHVTYMLVHEIGVL
jgi:hypothetical protein